MPGHPFLPLQRPDFTPWLRMGVGIPSLGIAEIYRYAHLTPTETVPDGREIATNGAVTRTQVITIPAYQDDMFLWFFSPFQLVDVREEGTEYSSFNALPAFIRQENRVRIRGVLNYAYRGEVMFYPNEVQNWTLEDNFLALKKFYENVPPP